MNDTLKMSRKALTLGIVLTTVLWSMMAAALVSPMKASAAGCVSGTLIKGPSQPAVYYCGADGKRYVFTNDKNYWTWYADFSGVNMISDSELASIMIGGNVTYRPGVKMIKIQSDPRVYAISHGGVLHAIASEALAACLYGSTWNKQIDDISDAFFVNYTVGAVISACAQYDRNTEMSLGQTINANLSLTMSTSFSVSSTMPASGAANVAVDAAVSAKFSSAADGTTVTASSFTLMKGSASVAGAVSVSGDTATFTPSAHLDANATYTAKLTTMVKGMNGQALSAEYSWNFTTSASGDVTAPTVTAISPPDGAASVALGTEISATFSEAMNVASINTTTFTLMKGSTSVAGTVTYAGNKYVFTPTASLQANSTYTAKIDASAKDLNGNLLSGGAYSWSFTTAP